MLENPTILVLSHLRWDFVYQRPQHLMAGLAATYRILYIEEPVLSESNKPEWRFQEALPNITVCRPHTPCKESGFHPLTRRLGLRAVVLRARDGTGPVGVDPPSVPLVAPCLCQ